MNLIGPPLDASIHSVTSPDDSVCTNNSSERRVAFVSRSTPMTGQMMAAQVGRQRRGADWSMVRPRKRVHASCRRTC